MFFYNTLYNCILGILYFIHFPLTHVTRDFHEDFKVEQASLSFSMYVYTYYVNK